MVSMVHHHPEDVYEILSLKKVLTSTLSAKVAVSIGLAGVMFNLVI